MSGTGLYLGPPDAARAVQDGLSLADLPATTGQVLGATAASWWEGSIGPRAWRWAGRQLGPDSPTLDPADATERFGIPGVLKFDRPVSEATAQALRDEREAEQRRQAVIARREGGLATSAAARGALGFVVSALDPVNLAAVFMPLPPQVKVPLLAATRLAPVFARRAAVGGAEGAFGMALLEPAEQALSRAEHNDRTMSDTLGAIAFGTVLGGGLHAGGGAVVDALRGRPRPTPVQRMAEAAAPEQREAALRGAVAAVAEGRPVAVQAVFDLPTAPSYRPVAEQARPGAYAAFTPAGQRIEALPEVVDLGSLIPSHTADGAVNPLYPHAEGLQPRDRGTAGSQDQVRAIAANLQPERLLPGPEAGAGAPLVDARGVVESGNGRLAAIEQVYTDPALAHRAEAYRAFLEAQGYDLAGIDRPVLVGRRITELDADQARAFARGANERPNLAMSAAEQARADAERAGRAIDQLQPGGLATAANRDFVRSFLAQLPAEERGGLILADGRLAEAGERRIRAAMLAHAYGDALGPTLERMLNGEVENLRTLAGALTDTAGAWGRLRAAAARGDIPADLDITAPLGEAVQLIEQARRAGRPLAEWLAQADAFAAPPAPATLALLRLMHADDGLTRRLSRERMGELLARYADQAQDVVPGPDMFGTPPPGPAELLRAAVRHIDPDDARQLALDDLARAPRGAAEDIEASDMARAAAEKAAQADAGATLPGTPPAAAQRLSQAAELDIARLEALPLDAGEQAQLRALREAADRAEGDARAAEAAARCLIGER